MSSDNAPSVPAFLESRKYMQGFATSGDANMVPKHLPSGQSDASVIGFELKYRKKKDYEIMIEAEVEYSETKHEDPSINSTTPFPPRCWASKAHDHARFATLVPIKIKLMALPSATSSNIRNAIETLLEESVEKLNAWWNQKETEHLRARYVGSLFIYNPTKFKIMSSATNKAWDLGEYILYIVFNKWKMKF